ncbi:unnamed protein product [Phyllotreta striolata]|uniref:CCHC-type domain-containing protein n=1 Tax=Phyllotreta striolata TaxID=444603 RepID=A0A9P0DWX9_PHYSR|nr:unnamed protein product [Phyllotreta striolata]
MDPRRLGTPEGPLDAARGFPRSQMTPRSPPTTQPPRKRKNSSPSILDDAEKAAAEIETTRRDMDEEDTRIEQGIQDILVSTVQDNKKRRINELNETDNNTDNDDKDENTIDKLIALKDNIIRATSRMEKGKLTFNRADQTVVQESLQALTNIMIKLVYNYGQTVGQKQTTETDTKTTNKDNTILKEIKEIKMSLNQRTTNRETSRRQMDKLAAAPKTLVPHTTDDETIDTDEDWKVIRRRTRKTYADMTKDKTDKTTKENTGWTTPPTVDNLRTIVAIDNVTNPRQVVDKIKQATMTETNKQGGLRNIIPLPGGKVILHCRDQAQKTTLMGSLTKDKDLVVIDRIKHRPKFTITGVTKGTDGQGLTDNDIIDMILNENDDINDKYGQDLKKRLKIVARKNCRNAFKENIVVEADVETFKYFVKKDRVYIDMVATQIQEAVSVGLCFNCHKYGHVAKYCKDEARCHLCGGSHNHTKCEAKHLDCLNCKAAKIPEGHRHHSARDKLCPIYERKLRQSRQYIHFNGTALQYGYWPPAPGSKERAGVSGESFVEAAAEETMVGRIPHPPPWQAY